MNETLDKIIVLENKITESISLLELACAYCEHNFDKGKEVINLSTLMNCVLQQQKDAMDLVSDIT